MSRIAVIAVIALKPRDEIIGSDKRFKVETEGFSGSYTNLLSKACHLGKVFIVEEDDNGNFVLNSLDSAVHQMNIHRSWAKEIAYPLQTADDLVALVGEDTP